MPLASLWPVLIVGAAALQVARNAAQRELTQRLGIWGAAYMRFIYGLPFALIWTAGILAWKGASGAPSLSFFAWVALGAVTQGLASALLVLAMRTRAFAVATALSKTEVLGSALLGMLLIQDTLGVNDWLGAVLGTAGVILMAHVSVDRAALRAALAGAGSGLLFSFSAIGYRAAAHAWGGDPWVGAAAALTSTLFMQTVGGGVLLVAFARPAMKELLKAWRPSLPAGAAGAFASALLFTGFALGPSAAAVKTVQLVDVLMAWAVSRRLFREQVKLSEIIGGALVLAGAMCVLL